MAQSLFNMQHSWVHYVRSGLLRASNGAIRLRWQVSVASKDGPCNDRAGAGGNVNGLLQYGVSQNMEL